MDNIYSFDSCINMKPSLTYRSTNYLIGDIVKHAGFWFVSWLLQNMTQADICFRWTVSDLFLEDLRQHEKPQAEHSHNNSGAQSGFSLCACVCLTDAHHLDDVHVESTGRVGVYVAHCGSVWRYMWIMGSLLSLLLYNACLLGILLCMLLVSTIILYSFWSLFSKHKIEWW
jgi:hypothetical protein